MRDQTPRPPRPTEAPRVAGGPLAGGPLAGLQLAVLLLGLSACGDEPYTEPPCPEAPFAQPGPHVAGVTTLSVNGNPVEVWYPAASAEGTAPDAYDMREWLPAAMRDQVPADAPTTFTTDAHRDVAAAPEGGFPLVYFSHGIAGYRLQSSALLTHLATWGYVVVAPEHPERNLERVLAMDEAIRDNAFTQILEAHDRLLEENGPGGRFEGLLDPERIAVMGHSAGGGAVTALVDDSELGADAWIGLATISAPGDPVPGMILAGTTDGLATPTLVQRTFDQIPNPDKRLVILEGAGHLAFSDICVIGRDRGGVLQIAADAGLEVSPLVAMLANDGCRETDLPPERAWPVIRHFVTAHLEGALRAGAPVGLGDDAAACFPDRVGSYAHP